jgi:hypothetical protein
MVKSQVPSHRNMIALSWYCSRFFNIDQMKIFHNQNEKLEKQLKLFNSLVQDINLSCCPKAKNTVQFIYMSPNFTKDILHKTKGSNG